MPTPATGCAIHGTRRQSGGFLMDIPFDREGQPHTILETCLFGIAKFTHLSHGRYAPARSRPLISLYLESSTEKKRKRERGRKKYIYTEDVLRFVRSSIFIRLSLIKSGSLMNIIVRRNFSSSFCPVLPVTGRAPLFTSVRDV